MKKASAPHQELTFQSRLESISSELEYYALAVPAQITKKLGTHGPVPVYARINGSKSFLISLYPVGGGRHFMRVKASVRKEAKIQEGDRVRVQITVRDRSAEITIPKDLLSALKAEGVAEHFKDLPAGKKSFMLRQIEAAAKPETREKRIQAAVEEAHRRREKIVDRSR